MAKEVPYSKIDPREMKDLEAVFGHRLTPELAQCLIRYRINSEAIDLMLRKDAASGSISAAKTGEAAPGSASNRPAKNVEGGDGADELGSEDELSSRQPGARRAARKAVA